MENLQYRPLLRNIRAIPLQVFDKGPADAQMVGYVLDVHAPEQIKRIAGKGFDVAGAFGSEVRLQPGDFSATDTLDAFQMAVQSCPKTEMTIGLRDFFAEIYSSQQPQYDHLTAW